MSQDREEIAIIGMAGRFPGAPDVERFWRNLCEGVSSIRPFTPEELRAAGVDRATLDDPAFVNAGAVLDEPEGFDAAFFGVGVREAEIMDPQHRVLLECAWTALEDAGYDPARIAGPVGVFGGVAPNTYFQHNLLSHPELLQTLGHYPVMIASEREYALTRIAFKLDLHGPALSVNTACSTSGVALHLACQSLLSGECDMALVGGARIKVPLTAGYVYQEDGILSPDGSCRAFDAEARGTVVGNGAAVVVLKRLSEALEDGDNITAVIKGTAINNDGGAKVGYTAPGVAGQAAVIAEALAVAEVDAGTIGYLEAHGTATALGDPIEVAALTRAFRESTDRQGYCALGSLKTNVGHLDAAAGLAGVIKAALALKHKKIPPSLNFRQPNPQIDFASSPFFVNDRLRDWMAGEGPRRAGVSSFGLGGTNAHIVLEEAPEPTPGPPARSRQLLLLSARSPEALERATANLAAHLQNHPDQDLADVAFTLAEGRRRFAYRRALVAESREDAITALRSNDPRRLLSAQEEGERRQLVFMFPGGGAQYPNMARELYQEEAVFRDKLDACMRVLEPLLGLDLRPLLFPAPEQAEEAGRRLEAPSLALPALLAVEVALAELWQSWGLQPGAVIGHSVGEYAAAWLAGVFSLEDALKIVCARGRLFETLPAGAMLSVPLSEAELAPFLEGGLSIAAVNKPSLCVVSGPSVAIDALEQALAAQEVDATRLHISVAAHSEVVEPILDEFRDFLKTVAWSRPALPMISNVTGRYADPQEVATPDYWVRHLRHTVRFAEGMGTLLENPETIFLEVGPGQTLSTFARQHPARTPRQPAIASVRHPKEPASDLGFLLGALGRLWLAGVDIDWQQAYGPGRRRVALPGYPFERQRYWIDAASPAASHREPVPPRPAADQDQPPEREDVKDNAAQATSAGRHERIVAEIQDILYDLSGLPREAMDPHAGFIELGFDSLLLTQAGTAFKRKFGVKVTFRQLFEEAPTIGALADYLGSQLPPEAFAPPPAPEPAPQQAVTQPATQATPNTLAALPDGVPTGRAPTEPLERVIAGQLQLMAEQLRMLGGNPAALPVPAVPQAAAPASDPAPAAASSADLPAPKRAKAGTAIGPVGDIKRATRQDLNARQQAYLDEFVARYTSRTQGSKQLTQANRAALADPVTVYGFSPLWKEMVYLLHLSGSAGSKVYDIDGNEYVDLTMGFGANLLGHSPEVVTRAVREQLERGVELCGISPQAGEVAALMCELTGLERMSYANSGSEAVLGAIRIARTATGRDKIATFTGAYHGRYDAVLIGRANFGGEERFVSQVPGVTRQVAKDTIVLDYGDPAALERIRAHADELAAVMVEPVQSRNPALQPAAFLQDLRALTRELGIPLVFDEVITGFRAHLGGAQAYFGIQADIATYGKAMGGGMPIAMIGGKAEFMDAFDGGMWRYGDDSFPEAGVTFLGGTFIRHPLALAASRAALAYLKEQGPALQQGLNDKTAALAAELNDFFTATGVPLRVDHFSSLFVFKFQGEQPFSGLFFFLLRDKGLHVYESSRCFLSTAHTDEDIAFIARVVKESAAEMQRLGFLEGGPTGPQGGSGWSQGAASRPPEPTPVAATASHASEVPLSEAQQEIWLATRFGDDASMAYNISFTLELGGALDPAALRRSVATVVARHEALRTVIDADGQFQRILPDLALDVPMTDLADLTEDARQARVREVQERHVATPFDLTAGPLLRFDLLRLAPERHLLIASTHHIVCDGWSLGVMIRELGELYRAARSGTPAALAPAMQLREYVRWLQDQSGSPEAQEARSYWLEQYAEIPPVLDLPTDHPRPPIKTYRAAREQLELDEAFYEALTRFGKARGFTLFTLLLGACEILLFRLTGQGDIALGMTAAGQTIVGEDHLVGHCVNTLPLRSRLGPNQSAEDYLASLRGAVLDAFEYRNFTYGTLISALRLPRDPSRPPLLSATFNLDPMMRDLDFGDLETRLRFNPRQFENFDLFFNCLEVAGHLTLEITYNTDLFEAATMARWLRHTRALLEGIMAQPAAPLSELPLMTDTERRRILEDWNDTTHEVPPTGVAQLFEAQAADAPERPAVIFKGRTLSYGQLNERANTLARALLDKGVGPGARVGLYLERSPDMVAALLAVRKTGAAYVPLDPAFPIERLRFMIADAELATLMADRPLPEGLDAGDAQLLLLRDVATNGAPEATNPEPRGGPEDLAYLLYTSGSTGRPKGVMVPSRALSNFLASMAERPGMTPDDRLLAVTTLSFDIAGLEIFLPLVTGACLELLPQEAAVDGLALREHLENSGATVMQATPATWRLLLEAGWQGNHELKALCGGEALPADLADALLARAGEVWNMYGPTETTIWSAVRRLQSGEDPVRVGGPIFNTRLYVLDEQLAPLPVGLPGELFIGGDGVALGYWNRPELTAEKFVPDPFSDRPGARLYRTGDLVRLLEDGTLEFLGRLDHQVKLRGYRIELGEIEAALARHPRVRQAVVTARDDGPGGRWLVAYLLAEPQAPTAAELRDYLKDSIPDYMLPGAFVILDALPLTPNNKVDRRALPAPEAPRSTPETGFMPARNELEERLAGIWCEVLDLDQVGVFDNFFELGGDSMLAMQVVTRANREGIHLSPRHLFEFQTVAGLARQASHAPAVLAEQGEVSGPVPLTPSQLRFLGRNTPDPHHWNISTLLEPTRPLDPALLERTLAALLAHHDALRLRLYRRGDVWEQTGTPMTDEVPFASFDFSDLDPEKSRRALEREAAAMQAGLDLSEGPMLRLAHFRLPDGERLFAAVHHFVIDAFSWTIFWEDFEMVYRQLEEGRRPELPPKTTSFAAWAKGLQARAQTEEVRSELDAWLALPWRRLCPLPRDTAAGDEANTNGSAREVEVILGRSDTTALLTGLPAQLRPEELLIAALTRTLAPWTGASALLFDMMGHGREELPDDQDVSRTVGFFISYTPKLVTLPDGDLLTGVSKQLQDFGYRHFDLLRYACDDPEVQEKLAALPRAQVLFNYHGQLGREALGQGLFRFASEDRGAGESPRGLRYYPLSVSGEVAGEELRVRFVYSRNLHRRRTITKLAQSFLDEVRELVRQHAAVPAARGHSR